MDRYKYNNNLSNKLNLVLFTSINSNIKIKNDPIPYLLTNYSEIEAFFELKNETKILYFNMKSIHPILYEYDKVIKIKESEDNQSSNFYLLLLIKSESDLIKSSQVFLFLQYPNSLASALTASSGLSTPSASV